MAVLTNSIDVPKLGTISFRNRVSDLIPANAKLLSETPPKRLGEKYRYTESVKSYDLDGDGKKDLDVHELRHDDGTFERHFYFNVEDGDKRIGSSFTEKNGSGKIYVIYQSHSDPALDYRSGGVISPHTQLVLNDRNGDGNADVQVDSFVQNGSYVRRFRFDDNFDGQPEREYTA